MTKNSLKNKLEGDELDLSMLNLTVVPVKEIASLPRATKIDLSSNQLVSLPRDFFPSVPYITRLELGSNKLKSLPDNIDKLVNLKQLDLYNNQIAELPVSLCNLRNLRWLDLKGNPLNSGLKKIAGDCLNQKECETAARKVIAYLKRFYIQMEQQKIDKENKEREKELAIARAEEELQAKKRAERKALKEKRKQEHKALMESKKPHTNGSAAANQKYVPVQKPATTAAKNNRKNKSKKGWSCLGWFNFLLMLCLMGASAAALFVYTDGNITPDGIAAAYPRIVENANALANLTAEALQPDNLKLTAQTVILNMKEIGSTAWAKLEKQTGDLSPYTDPILATLTRGWVLTQEVVLLAYDWLAKNIDWDSIWAALRTAGKYIVDQWTYVCTELSKNENFMAMVNTLKTYLIAGWEYLGVLWVALCHQMSIVIEYIQEEGPGILASVKEQATTTIHTAKQSIEGLMK